MKHFISLFVLSLLLLSCKYRLTDNMKKWNPYKAGDVLVFESNNNQLDTLFITGIKKTFVGKNEIISVECSFFQHDTISPIKVDTVNSWLMALTAWENGRAVVSINLNTKTARFAPFNAKAITWLDSLPHSSFDLSTNHYKDVVTIEPDTNSLNYSTYVSDSLFVNKILWSKSGGLMKYEIKHKGTSWTLKEKYSL